MNQTKTTTVEFSTPLVHPNGRDVPIYGGTQISHVQGGNIDCTPLTEGLKNIAGFEGILCIAADGCSLQIAVQSDRDATPLSVATFIAAVNDLMCNLAQSENELFPDHKPGTRLIVTFKR